MTVFLLVLLIMVIAIKTRVEQISFLVSAIAKIKFLDDSVMNVFQDIGGSGCPLAETVKVTISSIISSRPINRLEGISFSFAIDVLISVKFLLSTTMS